MSTGGKAIGAGSYGCVFRPSIPCRYSDRKTGQISKLMTRREARKELAEMNKVRKLIPKNSKIARHILLHGAEMCVPSSFTPSDFTNFDNECRGPLGLNKRISLESLNRTRSSYRVINMTDGGEALSTQIQKIGQDICNGRYASFKTLNTKLVNLLKDAVFPINKLDLIHLDLKPANIVTNQSVPGKPLAIIDWGLASVGHGEIYKRVSNKPLQYNLPFTCVLLKDTINREISRYFWEQGDSLSFNGLAEYLLGLSIKANPGHAAVIRDSIHLIDEKLNPSLVVTNYLAAALKKYSVKEGTGIRFLTRKYIDEVFSKNADLWGVLSCYADILEVCHRDTPLVASVRRLLIEYMFSPKYAARPISEKKFLDDLKSLSSNLLGRRGMKTRRRIRR